MGCQAGALQENLKASPLAGHLNWGLFLASVEVNFVRKEES